jgi:hypothetical protein
MGLQWDSICGRDNIWGGQVRGRWGVFDLHSTALPHLFGRSCSGPGYESSRGVLLKLLRSCATFEFLLFTLTVLIKFRWRWVMGSGADSVAGSLRNSTPLRQSVYSPGAGQGLLEGSNFLLCQCPSFVRAHT